MPTVTTAPCNVGYMTKVPVDPSNGATYFYSYACPVSPTVCPDYALRATLEVASNPALATDIDSVPPATFLGCACADPAYCVSP
jgi:hypothetical protein